MSSLVDPYGYPVSSKLLQGADRFTGARPYWPVTMRDTREEIPYTDWQTTVSFSRRLYANDGLVKGAIDQMAMHSIGRAWCPHFDGEDKEWGKLAQTWLEDEWFPVADVRGNQFDFKTNLFNDSVALDVDGDFAVILTETESGYPQTQHIPAHKIGQRDMEKVVKKGPLKGRRIEQGVIVNEFWRVIGIRILGETEAQDQDIIANDCIFVFNATRADQIRGIPSFAHAINELRDAWQAQQSEQITHQLTSSISLLETNENGGVDPNDPTVSLGTQGAGSETLTTQQFGGGLVKYFKAGTGSKVEELLTGKPGPAWEAFQDRCIRKALVGLGWPYSLFWKSDGLSGPAERSQIELARATIRDRQDLLAPVAKRQIFYALAKAAKLGIIPQFPSDWYKWSFTVPPKFSIDNGRDGQSRREDYKIGHKNLRDILGEQGIDYDAHRAQRGEEVEDLLTQAQEISAEKNVPFGLVLSLLQQQTSTASVGGGVFGTPVEDPNNPTPDPAQDPNQP
jgi:hypothetical protein